MKIREIMAILSQHDPELDCHITVDYRARKLAQAELRELTKYDEPTIYDRTILQIRGDSYVNDQQPLGQKVLLGEKRELLLETVLNYLANEYTPHYPRFTGVHGDWRFYYPGGNDATCYGTAYDPRLFVELEHRGWIESSSRSHSRVPNYTVTKAGREHLLVISVQA